VIVLGVIPARLASTRLPRKALREIAGLPLVVHVFRNARRSPFLSDLVVATDAAEVMAVCRAHDVPAVMTSADHPSGTDRTWEVAQSRAADVYVNVQGDEPMISPGHIERLVTPFREDPSVQVTTLRLRATDAEAANRSVTKVVINVKGDALYFSKLAIPNDRDGRGGVAYWKHMGLYAFRRAALDTFHALPPSPLEQAEQLEQLRLMEAGIPIRVIETDEPTVEVNTEEDLRAAEAALLARRR
jgi:3-deoxy-manno-octulosonate cytidylyltransferase (CMP-KDO synthetase)